MKKLFSIFLALTLSAGLWANKITYTATEALPINDNTFNIVPSSHTWSEQTQKGEITFNPDVQHIFVNAFKGSKLISMTLPGTITTIHGNVFQDCSNLTSITFEGVVPIFDEAAFNGTAQAPVTLILPEDWNYNAAPTDNQTAWHGGYFNSNIYSTQESTDKQAALDAINGAMGGHPESAYLQSLVAEHVTNITNAHNRKTINENRQAAIAILTPIVAIYPIAFAEGDAAGYARGKAEGIEEGKAEALGEMGEPCTNCPSIEVTKGDKTIKLYNPEKVEFKKE
ncbi:MAG: leucine-rich repeat domain-containing protein [Bacteroidales bacterium]|nr:leucine-rich repeat domain-containing protein [Bacteroidales bacterium]